MNMVCRVLDRDGRRLTQKVEAADAAEAREILRKKGYFVSSVLAEAADGAGRQRSTIGSSPGRGHRTGAGSRIGRRGPSAWSRLTERMSGNESRPRLSQKALLLFTRQMHMLLSAGSAVVPALRSIRKQLRKPSHVAVLDGIIADLESGQPLSRALQSYPDTFDATFISIIAAGEASAMLDRSLERLTKTIARKRTIRTKIISSSAYPALLIVMSIGIMLVMLFFVIPRFGDMMKTLSVPIPASTRWLLATAGFLATYWPIVVMLIIVVLATSIVVIRTRGGRRWLIDVQTRIPALGKLVSRLIQANFYRTMGALVESGVSVLDSIELSRNVTTNRHFKLLFDDMERSVTSGQALSDAVEASGLTDAPICQAIRTGEESGRLGPALTFGADLLDEENTAFIDALTKLIEPVILIFMGTLVAGVAISLFMPMFDITAAVRR